MWDLFKGEWQRYRGWAVAYVGLHLLLLGFMTRVLDLAQQPLLIYRAIGAVYALTGLLLGLYQMGGYRRPNAWLNLLHRPLPAWRIAIALSGGGVLLLAIAIALPLLIAAGYQATVTARVVDARHWMLPLASLSIASCGYLAGACCMLGGRRYSTCALVFLILIGLAQATGAMALVLQGLALLWLAGMVIAAFKPDLSAPPRSLAATVVTAVPLQMGAYLLILLLGFGIEMLWIMQGSHPTNTATPPPGGHNEAERMTARERMLAGLAVSDAAEAPLWREQVALSDVQNVNQQIADLPVRHALTNTGSTEFVDEERRIRWTFSHDSMRFAGYRTTDGRRVDALGVGADNAPFPAPAMAAGNLPALPKDDATLIAGNMLYHYVSETGHVLPRIRLPAGETLAGVTPVGENLVVMSDRALYVFDGRGVIENEALLTPRQRVPLPGKIGDLARMELIELVDGYLVSFTFTWHAYDLFGAAPFQTMVWVNDAGQSRTVARRAISYDFPALYRYKAWWPSPVMYALREGALNVFAAPDPLHVMAPPPVPRDIRILAIALSVLSLLAALWVSRRQALSMPARVAWIVACGAIGLPALVSLCLLYPMNERREARTPTRSTA
jgi:hypothetical protein